MCGLLAPAKPGEKSYQELVKLIQDYLAPKPSEIVQRIKFNNHFRTEEESVADFVAALRNLTEHCEYGRRYPGDNAERQDCVWNVG